MFIRLLLFCHCKHLHSQTTHLFDCQKSTVLTFSQNRSCNQIELLINCVIFVSIFKGTYQGQWLRGLRHGYGVRTSAPFGMASRFRPKSIRSSMTSLKSDVVAGHHGGGGLLDPAADRDKRLDDGRGGFVLKSRSDEPPARRRSFSERSSTIKKTLFQVFSCVFCFVYLF